MARKTDGESSRASRGKDGERLVTKHLKELLESNSGWWFHRFPDAGACMGRLQAQPADYIARYMGHAFLFDVKEVQREGGIARSRLTQVPKMRLYIRADAPEFEATSAGFLLYFWEVPKPYWQFVTLAEAWDVPKGSVKTTKHQRYATLEEFFNSIEDHILTGDPSWNHKKEPTT